MPIIKKVVRSICMGYSLDGKETHYQHDVITTTDKKIVMYSTNYSDEKTILLGDYTIEKPIVDNPIE